MQDIGNYIVQTLGGIYLLICLLRVILQLVRANYYNQMSQAVVMATKAPIQILRPLLPNTGRIDLAAILWMFIVALGAIQASSFLAGYGLVDIIPAISWAVIGVLHLLYKVLFYGGLAVIVINLLIGLGGMRISHPLVDFLNQLIFPFMAPLRRIIPPFGGLDLSPILFFLTLEIIRKVIIDLAISTQLIPVFVLGF